MFPREIETDRLRLERLCHDTVDVYEYYELWATAHPEVFEHLSATPFATVKEASDEIDDAETFWDDGHTATYLVRPKEGEAHAGVLAGRTSLDCEWDRGVGRLGIMLSRPFWGRGYSGERAGALLELAFERLHLSVVSVNHRDGNERSRRAIEKYVDEYGGQYDGVKRDARTPDEIEIHHRYSVTRAEYRDAVG